MASSQATKAVNLIAGEDLRSDLYELLKFENDSGQAKVIKVTATTDTPIGVLAENPRSDVSTDGYTVPVVLLQGVVLMKAGASITAGQLVIPDATAGRVAGAANQAALAADVVSVGVALTSADDGDVFPVLAQVMTSSTET